MPSASGGRREPDRSRLPRYLVLLPLGHYSWIHPFESVFKLFERLRSGIAKIHVRILLVWNLDGQVTVDLDGHPPLGMAVGNREFSPDRLLPLPPITVPLQRNWSRFLTKAPILTAGRS